jgi:hypothetical protein
MPGSHLGLLAPATEQRRAAAHARIHQAYDFAVQNGKIVTRHGIPRADFDDPSVQQILGSVRMKAPYPVITGADGKMPGGMKKFACEYNGEM